MHDFDHYLNDYEMFGAIDPEFNSIVPTLVGIYAVIFGIALLIGIAYYAASERIFVTGKRWSKLFEIEIIPQ